MKLTWSCILFLLPNISGRRPRIVRPVLNQYQENHPFLRHDNTKLKWTRPSKPVKSGILGDRLQITDYRLQDNRWNQHYAKKFPRFPPKKFVGPKKGLGRQRVKMVPVPDLRPHSIDKIDIYRPEKIDFLKSEEVYTTPEIVNNRLDNQFEKDLSGSSEPNLQFGGVKVKPIGTVLTGEKPVNQQNYPPILGGIKIYMFKGEEGLGVYDEKKENLKIKDKIVQVNINDNKIGKYDHVIKPIAMFKGDEGLGVYDKGIDNNIINNNFKVINKNNNGFIQTPSINSPINPPSNINSPINIYNPLHITPNNNNSPLIRWSQAEVTKRPTVTEVTTHSNNKLITSRDMRPAPFPTRHTTRAPDKDKEPIIIIGQSVVESNMVQTTTWSPTEIYQT